VSYLDAIAIAARSVTRRLGRAVLTVLAVALAAALLSSLLIAGSAARSRVLDDVSRGGPLTGIRVDAAAPDPGALDSDNPPQGAPRHLDEAARKRIAALPGVRDVVGIVVNPIMVIPPANLPAPTRRRRTPSSTTSTPVPTSPTTSVRRGSVGPPRPQNPPVDSRTAPFRDALIGVDLSRSGDVPVTATVGRLPSATSTTEVAVTEGFLRRMGLTKADAQRLLGTEVEIGAPRLFESAGHTTVRGRWTRMSIVGVVAQEIGDGQFLAPIATATTARRWASQGVNPAVFGVDASPYSALFVVARSLSLVAPVRAEITKVGFSTSAPETLIASVQRYLHVVEIVLAGIGLIGLVIAALGITNAMLAAVRERRREIGVLKAIGARDRDVRRIFLLEAATLGFVGGAIGTTAGWLTARALAGVVNKYLQKQGLAGVSLGVPTTVLVGGVIGATLLALVAGMLPAQRAARLPARQAMGDR
jgi:cell division protein FtsX